MMNQPYLPLRRVLAVGLGNALEFYDFLTFSYFAIQIGHTFFPESQTSHGLLYSLATFGVGFITRPLGAWIIGRYGDRVGRKPAMLWSFGLMGLGILGLALTPSYARIGAAAPVVLVCFRLLQGLALGGEVGPSTAYLVEAAPPHRRGLYVAMWITTQYLAGLAAGVVGFTLSALLSPAQLDAWGWRLAMLIGAAVVPVGLYIRRRLPETLHSPDSTPAPSGQRLVSTGFIVLTLMLLAAGVTSSYVVDYINTYVQDTLKLAVHLGFGAVVVECLVAMGAAPIGGALSDRFGRRPVFLTAATLLLLLAVPCYGAMAAWRSVPVVYAATAVLSLLAPIMIVAGLTTISESLPQSVRSAGYGILYAIGTTVFGSFTQFNIKALIDATGSPLAPAWYLSAALVCGALAMLVMKESAPCRTQLDERRAGNKYPTP
jgi:MHS family citrate/tricarballylate:H+ symporter-like MFS transporter